MLPIHKDVYDSGIAKPLLFINSFDFQTKENIEKMLRLVKEPNESGVSTCPMLTLRCTCLHAIVCRLASTHSVLDTSSDIP